MAPPSKTSGTGNPTINRNGCFGSATPSTAVHGGVTAPGSHNTSSDIRKRTNGSGEHARSQPAPGRRPAVPREERSGSWPAGGLPSLQNALEQQNVFHAGRIEYRQSHVAPWVDAVTPSFVGSYQRVHPAIAISDFRGVLPPTDYAREPSSVRRSGLPEAIVGVGDQFLGR